MASSMINTTVGHVDGSLLSNVSTTPSILDLTNSSGADNVTSVPDTAVASDYFKVQKESVYKFVPPVLIVWGVVGNVLTILVILRQMRRLTSTSLYLLALALSDLLVLLCAPLQRWLLYTWQKDVRDLSLIGCKFHKFFTYAGPHWSSWLLVAVTLERAISVVNPYKVKRRCNSKIATVFVGVIFIAITALNSHFFYGYGERIYGGRLYHCIATNGKYFDFMHDIWPWVDFTFVFLLPFACLLLCNTIIIFRLATTRKRRLKLTLSQSQQQRSRTSNSHSISVMLVLLSVVFFVFTTPACVFYIYYPYRYEEIVKMSVPIVEKREAVAYLLFWEAVVNMFWYCNSCLNFVLYVFSGTKFRRELKALLTCTKTESDVVFSYGSTKTSVTHVSGRSTKADNDSPSGVPTINGEMATCTSVM